MGIEQTDAGTFPHRLESACPCDKLHAAPHTPAGYDNRDGRQDRRVDSSKFDRCTPPYPCDYRDAQGRLLFRVARWARRLGGKTYGIFHRGMDGEWRFGKSGSPRVVYRLPAVLAAISAGETIHICEGEKKVHALVALGLAATTSEGGAGNWRAEHTACLAGAGSVVIWPDNDEPGRRHGELVASVLSAAGVSDVRVVMPPGLPEGAGLDDWLALESEMPEPDLRGLLEAQVRATSPRPPVLAAQAAASDPSARRSMKLESPEPWPDPVDGAGLADEIAAIFDRYLVLPEGASAAMTLWLFHAHAHEAAVVSPLLLLSSPVRQCGKTRALELISGLVPRSLMTSNMTGAALFRSIEKFRPTLCIDEADSFLRLREDMRNLLNAGHSRAGAWVVRCAERTHEPQRFSTWAPKVVALIGRLHDTLESRSIIVQMRRRARHETVESMRLDRPAMLERPPTPARPVGAGQSRGPARVRPRRSARA